jgi:hypothetical protein
VRSLNFNFLYVFQHYLLKNRYKKLINKIIKLLFVTPAYENRKLSQGSFMVICSSDSIWVDQDVIASITFDYSFWNENTMTNWGSEYWQLIKGEGQ